MNLFSEANIGEIKKLLSSEILKQRRKNAEFARGEANFFNEPVWSSYEDKDLLWQAQVKWNQGKPDNFPPFDEYIGQKIQAFRETENKFNILEIGSPGGLCHDLRTMFPGELGVVTTVSLADGRSTEVRAKHDELGIHFIAGDVFDRKTFSQANKLSLNKGYDFIYAQLVSGWEVGIPTNPLASLLLLKRTLRLLKTDGILLADYFPGNARYLSERGPLVEKFYRAKHPDLQLEIRIKGSSFWLRKVK